MFAGILYSAAGAAAVATYNLKWIIAQEISQTSDFELFLYGCRTYTLLQTETMSETILFWQRNQMYRRVPLHVSASFKNASGFFLT